MNTVTSGLNSQESCPRKKSTVMRYEVQIDAVGKLLARAKKVHGYASEFYFETKATSDSEARAAFELASDGLTAFETLYSLLDFGRIGLNSRALAFVVGSATAKIDEAHKSLSRNVEFYLDIKDTE